MSARRLFIIGPCVEGGFAGDSSLRMETDYVAVTLHHAAALEAEMGMLQRGAFEDELSWPSRVLDELSFHGMLSSLSISPGRGKDFLRAFFALCDAWAEDIFASPFWEVFLSGAASDAQVWTFLAQLYHRTAGADVHNRIAAECCQDQIAKPLLRRHYVEEIGHARILAKGLRDCPGEFKYLLDEPLASTRALIDYMVAMAAEPVAYLGCYGVFHAPSTIRSERELLAQFEFYAGLYPYAAKAFAAVAEHAALDYRLGHHEIALEEWIAAAGPPTEQDMVAAVQGAHGAARAFRAIFDECVQVR